MNIVIVGCSQSEGIYGAENITRGEEWGAILGKKLDAKVHNFSLGGSTLKSYLNRLAWAVNNLETDLFIIQETTIWRDTLGFDGLDNIVKNRHEQRHGFFHGEINFEVSEVADNVTYYKCYDPNAVNLNPYSPKTDHYVQKIQEISGEYKHNVKPFIEVWQKHVAHSTESIYHDYCQQMSLIHLMLQHKRFITFPWIKTCHLKVDDAYSAFLNPLGSVWETVYSFLTRRYGEEWLNEHIVDEGFHLDAEAHYKICEEYLVPELLARQFI